ncbi:hypothetical protein RvY_05482 [Ramazzottius varieornatus]|uniref:MRH domain-containing protein n=1 Tax=Ramazzottius varieornatus TaxID=947166 RepID=A0A1D1UV46_RAMVA|nr:hypothetical protein RvY_05482 [Ramazzottius varieornatus]
MESIPYHMFISGFVVMFLQHGITWAQLAVCSENDIKFEITQCDKDNGFWRVAVPVNESLLCSPSSKPPLRVHGCDTFCPAGHYYSVEALECSPCKAGTYSSGNAQIYDDWPEIPSGFSTQMTTLANSGRSSLFTDSRLPSLSSCSKTTWTPRGDYISMQGEEGCMSRLLLEVDILQQTGSVDFEYQFPESGTTMFTFNVLSSDCRTGLSQKALLGDAISKSGSTPVRIFLDPTTRNSWAAVKTDLPKGKHTLVWTGISMIGQQDSSRKSIRIRKVQVSGVNYSRSCTVCPAGTSSPSGSSTCQECPMNHVSAKGSGSCRACPESQYALPGFLQCFDRPPCTEKDYLRKIGPCQSDGQGDLSFKWIEPMICKEDSSTSKLPATIRIPCPKCAPGTVRYNATACTVCDEGQFAGQQGTCQACPSGTDPAFKYEITSWNLVPYHFDSFCWSNSDLGCGKDTGWQLDGDKLLSGYGHEDDVLLVAQLFTAGFRKKISSDVYGQLTFEFDLSCKSPECQLDFLLEDTTSYETVKVKTWIGPQSRTKFEFPVTQNSSLAFTWTFTKINMQGAQLTSTKARQFGQDVARIFGINLTNTIDGGADKCQPCAGSGSQCRRCGPGQVWDTELTNCRTCPPNHVVSEHDASCVPCGENLVAENGKCETNCRVSFLGGKKHYDLTPLKGFHTVRTQHFFPSGGEEYYHVFNISLCETSPVVCANTAHQGSLVTSKNSVSGLICRTTHLVGDQSSNTTAVHSFVAGKELTHISTPDEDATGKVFAGVPPEIASSLAPDLYWHYRAIVPTSKCPTGKTTTIAMRCSKNSTDDWSNLLVPSECAEGTCDGCNYHLMWPTIYACPVCGPEDYTTVRGECISSQQKIYYHSNFYCRETNSSADLIKVVRCHSVPYSVQVLIVVLVGLGVLLTVVLAIFYKKGKKFEQRYTKLVQDASGVVHLQLPESCVDEHDLDSGQDQMDNGGTFDEDGGHFDLQIKTPSQTIFTKVKKAITKNSKRTLSNPIRDRKDYGGSRNEENELLAE